MIDGMSAYKKNLGNKNFNKNFDNINWKKKKKKTKDKPTDRVDQSIRDTILRM